MRVTDHGIAVAIGHWQYHEGNSRDPISLGVLQMTKTSAFALACAFLLPAAVQAQGVYLGAGVGSSIADIPDTQIPISNAQGYSLTKNETATTYRDFAGYQFTSYIAVEGGWIDLGTVSATRSVSVPFTGSATGSLKTNALNLDIIGALPIAGGFSALGRVGLLASRATDTRSVTGSVILLNGSQITQNATKADYGLGLQYKANANWSLRGEWERGQVDWYKNGTLTLDLFGASVVYEF